MNMLWPKEFSPDEWPDGVLNQMDPLLFQECLFPLRKLSHVPMIPSPLPEAHVRTKGDSRHSTKGGKRLSDATDVFIPSERAAVAKVLREALRIREIGGLGIYPTTSPSVMIHVDRRPERLLWMRIGDDYIYEVNDPPFFYAELAKQLERLPK